MPDTTPQRQVNSLTKRLEQYGHGVNQAVDHVGRAGGFGLAGFVVSHKSPSLGRQMAQIQGVYDVFGREATTGLMASHAAASAIKRLPKHLRVSIKTTAKSVVKSKPLLSKVLRIAESVARHI